MKARIFGSNLSAAYTALLLSDLGFEINWYTRSKWKDSIVPFKVSGEVMVSLRRLCHFYSLSSLKGTLVPGTFGDLNYSKTKDLLLQLCEKSGVNRIEENFWEYPNQFGLERDFNILASSEEEISHWPKEIFQSALGYKYWAYYSTYRSPTFFNSSFYEGSFEGGAAYQIEKAFIVLEALDETHFSLSVYAETKFEVAKILKNISDPKSNIVLPLKTLIIGSQRQSVMSETRVISGDLPFTAAHIIPIGAALGESSMMVQGQERWTFNQALKIRNMMAVAQTQNASFDDLRKAWLQKMAIQKKSAYFASKLWLSWFKRDQKIKPLGLKKGVLAQRVQEATFFPF